MSIRDKQNINVLNYNDSSVAVSVREKSYLIEAAYDGIPVKTPFTWAEIETINSNGNAFKSGILRFEDSEQDEIYKELRIVDWENILTNTEIESIILNPSFNGLQKIISIKSSSIFERVRGVFTKLKNNPNNDISSRVDRIITTRYKEILNGMIRSEIVLTHIESEKKSFIDEAAIQAENTQLRNEIAELKAVVAKAMANNMSVTPITQEQPSATEDIKKSAGRPPKPKE